MRQKLNENPVAQIALVGFLVVAVGFLLISSMGGGGEGAETASPEAGAAPSTEEAVVPTEESAVPTEVVREPGQAPLIPPAVGAVSAPVNQPMPRKVERAYAGDKTIAILLVRDGGIDDHLVRVAAGVVGGMSKVAFFSSKAEHVARFAAIAGPLGVNQVPALIVIRPKDLNGANPAPASVTYGFQTKEDVRQAIRDAVYDGRTLTYAPS
jgi:hypothetical protein